MSRAERLARSVAMTDEKLRRLGDLWRNYQTGGKLTTADAVAVTGKELTERELAERLPNLLKRTAKNLVKKQQELRRINHV